ncbi:heme/hemin ABC transporter substrate-binding protein [Pseudobdellovibrio exovorus]|uniref:heme/hemin ABC transporter substrate-binding protein n=1 Tax=Pseudobdellovibrio exovorus TaxID=453816 RepID=UPI00130DFAC4|nr:ABC transporter substrate-binding protein [Pseudobdellovibrio exovorus]
MRLFFVYVLPFVLLSFNFAEGATVQGADNTEVSVQNPKRLVVINSSATETLFALGLGDRIVGTDAGSTYPAVAEKLPKVGHPYRPSAEGIISLKPDLVIATEDSLPPATAQQIRSAKIPVLVLEASDKSGVDGYKRRVRMIAKAFDIEAKAEKEIQRFEEGLKKINSSATEGKSAKVFFLYAHGAASGRIYGTQTGPHYLIEAAGAHNAAESVEGVKDFTSEAMVKMQPDAILVLKRVSKNLGGTEGVLKLQGISLTPAGKNKRVIEIDDSVRWIGPRFPEFAQELNTALAK